MFRFFFAYDRIVRGRRNFVKKAPAARESFAERWMRPAIYFLE